MEWAYTAYGLRLLCNTAIPGLAPSEAVQPADVCVSLGHIPISDRFDTRERWYQSAAPNTLGRPNLIIWRHRPSGAFRFVYDDGTEFLISRDGARIWSTWPPAVNLDEAVVYLRGPILGMVLRLRGVVCLHAATVALGSSAIAIAGAAGAGKSTMAAGLVALGAALMADDMSALRVRADDIAVLPGPPRLSLWPDSVEAVYGAGRSLPRITPPGGISDWWDKRFVDFHATPRFQPSPLPLEAVYLLASRTPNADTHRIESIGAQEAFMSLIEETYVNYALDGAMRAQEFAVLGRLVRDVPVRRVSARDDRSELIAVCRSVLDDYGTAVARTAAAR